MIASNSMADTSEPPVHVPWEVQPPGWQADRHAIAPPCAAFQPGDVDLWYLSLPLPRETEEALHAILSPDEQTRAARFAARSARRQFVAGRGLLRSLLARYTGQPAQVLRLSTGPHGKPALAGPFALTFSVSHTEGLVIVAVAGGMEVGVDIERIRPIAGADRVAARYFTARECAELEAGPEGFLRLWTCRESALKACGLGISQGWDSLRIVRRNRDQAQAVGLGPDCLIQWLSLQHGFVAALAVMAPYFRIRNCEAVDETLDEALASTASRNLSLELQS